MTIESEDLIELAQSTLDESDLLDFKREYRPEKKAAFWAETVKDIISFANTRGGIIVFGVNDDGSSSEIDCTHLFSLDLAALADQIKKYTNFNFRGCRIVKVVRSGVVHPAIVIEPVPIPIPFSKVGSYEIEEGKQKTAFSLGTIYFRHGAKSEPCTRDDLREKIEAELESIRQEWLGNVRKVVEAEPGSTVVITRGDATNSIKSIRLTNDPDAPAARIGKLSDGYPHRQSDVIREVNDSLSGVASINTHDIQTIKYFEDIGPENSPQYVHKPHDKASPQYTNDFINFIVERGKSDPSYFAKCRAHWKNGKY